MRRRILKNKTSNGFEISSRISARHKSSIFQVQQRKRARLKHLHPHCIFSVRCNAWAKNFTRGLFIQQTRIFCALKIICLRMSRVSNYLNTKGQRNRNEKNCFKHFKSHLSWWSFEDREHEVDSNWKLGQCFHDRENFNEFQIDWQCIILLHPQKCSILLNYSIKMEKKFNVLLSDTLWKHFNHQQIHCGVEVNAGNWNEWKIG